MDSILKAEAQLGEARARRKKVILRAFDGRTQQNISGKTGIDFIKLNKWINGLGNLEDRELTKLENVLGVDLTPDN